MRQEHALNPATRRIFVIFILAIKTKEETIAHGGLA
jgi:hypothetical protein